MGGTSTCFLSASSPAVPNWSALLHAAHTHTHACPWRRLSERVAAGLRAQGLREPRRLPVHGHHPGAWPLLETVLETHVVLETLCGCHVPASVRRRRRCVHPHQPGCSRLSLRPCRARLALYVPRLQSPHRPLRSPSPCPPCAGAARDQRLPDGRDDSGGQAERAGHPLLGHGGCGDMCWLGARLHGTACSTGDRAGMHALHPPHAVGLLTCLTCLPTARIQPRPASRACSPRRPSAAILR